MFSTPYGNPLTYDLARYKRKFRDTTERGVLKYKTNGEFGIRRNMLVTLAASLNGQRLRPVFVSWQMFNVR